MPEHLNLASDLEFPLQSGQPALSPPSNLSPSPFMQFAATMAIQGNVSPNIKYFMFVSLMKEGIGTWTNLGASQQKFSGNKTMHLCHQNLKQRPM